MLNNKPGIEKKGSLNMTLIHSMIGIGFMVLFPLLDPIGPITEVGMHVLAIFVGMVYLWSAVESIWPSLLGLFLLAMCGFDSIKNVALSAFGNEVVVLVMISMVLFAAVEYAGCTQYLARWFLTRKVINGKPYIFLSVFFLSSFFLAGLTSPLASLLILWPIAVEFLNEFKVEKGDKAYALTIFGVYMAATFGQPMFPFKGAALAVVGTFQKISGLQVNYVSYVTFNIVMSLIMIFTLMLLARFVFKVDLSSFKNVNIEQFKKNPLPPMNLQQKLFLGSILAYIVLLMAPSILPKAWAITALLNKMGTLGVTFICVIVLMVIQIGGKPALPYKAVAAKSLSWDIYFLVAAAMYGADAVSNEATGIKLWLVQILQPLLGDKPELVFVGLLLIFILITTNFANNAGMTIILLPVVLAFADQYPALNIVAVSMCLTMGAFFAFLTPAASPYAGMMHARKDLIELNYILKFGFPICFAGLLIYALIGYQIAKFLF
ncbi:sodium-dependent dicarboxylate transporter 2/3/5 [Desulfitobacterium sp. LBE]|uniref:SLC13 family permease n=1 Tax=Desulfitobacterium sp. LBE TaxID=884086 RepID=UPI00119B903E|nr:SLC13 family permease [Desulfitobacterium sp. LBE]TWH59202.1 sodium-dependent dicarboxylate transporter 2/3/5 [Desulfitobacterium sp. LBE]